MRPRLAIVSPAEYHCSKPQRGPLERYSFTEDYVRSLAEADPEVERHFTAYFGDLLMIKLRSRLRSPQQVLDARQEVFLRVLTVIRKPGGIIHPERLGAFVNSVCNHVLLETFRGNTKYSAQCESGPDLQDERQNPEQAFVTQENVALVGKALQELSERDRAVLRMVFLEERDKDEVCATLKVDRNHLRLLVHRAKNRFRALLEHH